MKAQGNPTVRSYTRNDMWDPQLTPKDPKSDIAGSQITDTK